jgi:hypothetical protein
VLLNGSVADEFLTPAVLAFVVEVDQFFAKELLFNPVEVGWRVVLDELGLLVLFDAEELLFNPVEVGWRTWWTRRTWWFRCAHELGLVVLFDAEELLFNPVEVGWRVVLDELDGLDELRWFRCAHELGLVVLDELGLVVLFDELDGVVVLGVTVLAFKVVL